MRRAALLLVVALAGCGGSAPRQAATPTPTPTPTEADRIELELSGRAHVIEHEQESLGVRDASYVIEEVNERRVRARLSYSVRGVEGEFGSPRSFALRGTRIGRRLGSRDREPWEVGEVRRVDTPHFVVWVLDGVMTATRTLAGGYARLRATLGDEELKDRYLVVVVPDADALRAVTRRIAGLEQLSAVTDTQVRIGGRAEQVKEVRSQRLIINTAAFANADPASQEQVIAHELAHAVLAPRTSTRVPGWLVEGVALWASGDDRRPEYFALATVPTVAGLSAPDSIAVLAGDPQRAAYATASAAAFYIVDTYGEDALLDLLAVYNRGSLRGVRGEAGLTDRAMRRVLGIGIDEFQERLG